MRKNAQQERDQFRAANQQLGDQIQNLQNQLTQAKSRESELFDANAKLQRTVDELEQTKATLSSEVSRKAEDIQSLTRNAEEASKEMREYLRKNDQLAEKVAVITGMKAETEKNVAGLTPWCRGFRLPWWLPALLRQTRFLPECGVPRSRDRA